MDAASVNTPEIPSDLKYQGWNLQKVLSAGYVSERLMQRMVWMAKCSHSAPGLVPGSVLQHPGPSRTIVRDDSFVFRISCDLRVFGR